MNSDYQEQKKDRSKVFDHSPPKGGLLSLITKTSALTAIIPLSGLNTPYEIILATIPPAVTSLHYIYKTTETGKIPLRNSGENV